MKVFISWSGPQSKHVARALRNWLRNVIQNLNVWMSELDIKAGQQWEDKLRTELRDSHFGVVCLTAENLQAPWLHYEAGALAKAVEGRVCPYLYQLQPSAVQAPLSIFQMKQSDRRGTKELVESINEINESPLSAEQLGKTFDIWWSHLEQELAAVPQSPVAKPYRETRELVEEILELVRGQVSLPVGKAHAEDIVALWEGAMPSLTKKIYSPLLTKKIYSPYGLSQLSQVLQLLKRSFSLDEIKHALDDPEDNDKE